VARFHGLCHRAAELRPKTILDILEGADAFRRPERFADFLIACEADARGRRGLEDQPYPQANLMRAARDAAAKVTAKPFVKDGLENEQLGEAIRAARVGAIGQALGSAQI
jgi:tRNA nucleotidyltransferase (CCA-adding enzyme)